MTSHPYHHAGDGRGHVPPRRRVRALVVLTLILALAGSVMVAINTRARDLPDGPSGVAPVEVAAAAIEAQGGPDSVVAAFEEGTVTHVEIIGDHGHGVDTPFYIGSVSKMFTAVVVARLVDDGVLALDEPVVGYLPWFRTRGAYEQITVRHLLNQTSGLPAAAGLVDLTTPEISLEQRVRTLADVELENAPGSRFHYCTKNFAILALLVEAVTDRSYAEVLTDELIAPLGLEHTFVDPTAAGRDVTAGHLAMFGAQLPTSTRFFPAALADGYLISSASDVAVLADVLATGIRDGEPYLSPTILDQLRAAPAGIAEDPDHGGTYGFGLRLADLGGQHLLWHEGDLPTAHADVGVLQESRSGLVVLTAQNGQLYSPDTPFLSGMDRLAGLSSTGVDDGGFRAVALVMVGLASATIAWAVTDVLRWPTLGRRPRARRLLTTVVPRLLAACALGAGAFLGVGLMLGLDGAVPFAVLWAAAPDLTATVLTLAGYLAVSAAALALWPRALRPTLGR